MLKNLSKVFFVHTSLLFLSLITIFFLAPAEPGLYPFLPQIAPLILSSLFFIFKNTRKKFKLNFYLYFFLSFAFLTLDYLIRGHAGLFQLAVTFCPAFLYWLTLFARWNFARLKERSSRIALALSAIAWGFMAFAFPPLPLGIASVIFLVPWFIVLNRYSRNAILFATFWSGMLYNAINYYWIYNVMKVGPAALILLGLVLLIAYFSVYNVFAAFIYTLLKNIKIKNHAYLLILFPLFYAGLEMTRTRGDFSFPWSHLGYTFGNHLELIQLLSTIGIFGYTMLIIFSNMCVAKALEQKSIKKRSAIFIPCLILLGLFLHGNSILNKPEAAPFYNADTPENPSIAMIQPCIKQGEKWSKTRFDSIITKTFSMVYDSVKPNTDLIILAETAIPDHIRRQPTTIRRLHKMADSLNAFVLTGALDFKRNEIGAPRKFDVYNAAFLFSPGDMRFPNRYIKKHLVPFSERIPFDDIFPILNYVDLGEGDFVPGKETPVWTQFLWTPFICYDAIFGDLVRESIKAGSRLMVNITNDGWFGRSTAPYQHLNLVRYRAIENGIPVARLANSGVSAFIDEYGHFDLNTPIFEDAVIQRKVPLKKRHTLYEVYGDSFETFLLYFFAALILFLIVYHLKKKFSK